MSPRDVLPQHGESRPPVDVYVPDRDQRTSARVLAAGLVLTALVGLAPAALDLLQQFRADDLTAPPAWAYLLLWTGLLQLGYAFYVAQLPDSSSVRVVTYFLFVLAGFYAATLCLTLLASDQSQVIQLIELTGYLRGGRAAGWCLIMLSWTSLLSYLSARLAAGWHSGRHHVRVTLPVV